MVIFLYSGGTESRNLIDYLGGVEASGSIFSEGSIYLTFQANIFILANFTISYLLSHLFAQSIAGVKVWFTLNTIVWSLDLKFYTILYSHLFARDYPILLFKSISSWTITTFLLRCIFFAVLCHSLDTLLSLQKVIWFTLFTFRSCFIVEAVSDLVDKSNVNAFIIFQKLVRLAKQAVLIICVLKASSNSRRKSYTLFLIVR